MTFRLSDIQGREDQLPKLTFSIVAPTDVPTILNDFLLLSIDPTGKHDQHQLPRLQNEFHRHLGMNKTEKIIGLKRNVKLRGQSCQRLE